MTLYRVDVEERRNWTLYIDTADELLAEDAALELTAGFDADDVEVEAYADVVTNKAAVKHSEEVWVGGEEGGFISYANYKRGQHD